MNDATGDNQSFNVNDIRRLRDEADRRYEGMPFDEVVRDISAGAKEGLRILEELRQAKEKQQGA
jgi:hypothetical protein